MTTHSPSLPTGSCLIQGWPLPGVGVPISNSTAWGQGAGPRTQPWPHSGQLGRVEGRAVVSTALHLGFSSSQSCFPPPARGPSPVTLLHAKLPLGAATVSWDLLSPPQACWTENPDSKKGGMRRPEG